MIRVSVSGDNAVQLRLSRGGQRLRNLRPLLARIGQGLRRSFTINMTSGLGPNGEALPPVQKWTRLIAGKNPNSRVLHVTGSLRRSIGPLSVSATRLVFGFHGGFSRVASAQTLGTPGRIKVAKSMLRTARKSGKQYVRIKTNAGQWYTKTVVGGYVSVRPRPRRFFYLGRKDIAMIRREALAYVNRL